MTTYYKFLSADGRATRGNGQWQLPRGNRPGEWMPKIETLEACKSGYHVCTAEHALEWLTDARGFGPVGGWVVECRGASVVADTKVVFAEARLVERLDCSDKMLRLFAADCAARVLKVFEKAYPNDKRPREAIVAARLFARGKITQLAAAWAAAWDAACDAARDAAWAAAWDAARDAAGDAARDAARDAERAWQTKRLVAYMHGRVKRDYPLPKGAS